MQPLARNIPSLVSLDSTYNHPSVIILTTALLSSIITRNILSLPLLNSGYGYIYGIMSET